MSVRQYKKHRPVIVSQLREVEVPKTRVVRITPVSTMPLSLLKVQSPEERRKSKLQVVPISMIVIGVIMIASVLWPFFFDASENSSAQMVDASVANQEVSYSSAYGSSGPDVLGAVANKERPKPTILSEELDFTNLSAWFPNQDIPEVRPEEAKTYVLDIPSLKIEQAIVKVGGLNLDKNLIQYPGTANPGEIGAPIVFGHSTTPIFYNPSLSNLKRYTSIFTKIMTLKRGDLITLRYDGILYTYEVINKEEVKPDNVSILAQSSDERLLKIVTCVPPGTILRRGVVTARLKEVQ